MHAHATFSSSNYDKSNMIYKISNKLKRILDLSSTAVKFDFYAK